MLFFQVLLTGGYAYAAWLSRSNPPPGRFAPALLGLSLAVLLGLGPGLALPPHSFDRPETQRGHPAGAGYLPAAGHLDWPAFLPAGLQQYPGAGLVCPAFPNQSPYRLYALSNLSSLVALLAYPFLVEPNLSLPWQGWLWSLGYLAFAGLAAFTTVRVMRTPPEVSRQAGA